MIYLDNAATTRVDYRVNELIKPYFTDQYGNPSSVYRFVDNLKMDIDTARIQCANLINASPDSILFTSSGTESNNWVLKSIAEQNNYNCHIITSCIEHHSVLKTCEYLENKGVEVTYIPVNKNGIIAVTDIKNAIRPNTKIISIMMANNEIGSVQPIAEVGKLANENRILFHTDAVQAYGHTYIDVEDMHIDFLSASGHKINAPKGVGLLYARNPKLLTSFIHGGGQEEGLRAGTYNVPSIIGLGYASYYANQEFGERYTNVQILRNKMANKILEEIPNVKINGSLDNSLPNNLNICIKGVDSAALITLLSEQEMYVSSGSACNSGDEIPSHVLKAIGLSDEDANSSIRITLSHDNTEKEIEEFVKILKQFVKTLRFFQN